jgi:hypothetical protein
MDEFGIKDMPLKNFRLRTYDPQLKAKMAVHDHFDMQLHKLNFHSYMNLLVETRGEEEFEEWQDSWIFLRALKYVEGETYDFKQLDKLPC